jgi:hypothetical protein
MELGAALDEMELGAARDGQQPAGPSVALKGKASLAGN